MANKAEQKVFTGDVASIEIGGIPVGLCQTLEGRRVFNAEPIYGVGQWKPAEVMQQKYLVHVTVSKFFIRTKSLDDLGLAALSSDILTLGLLDLRIIDTGLDRTIRFYQNCVCHEYSEMMKANAICGENAVWICGNSNNGTTIPVANAIKQ